MRRARHLIVACALVSRLALAQGEAEITHPVAVHQVEAVYPEGLAPQHADVILIVTLDAQGNVTDVKIETSGGAPFDAAAAEAVRKWTFSPATKNGKPFAARLKIPFHFEPPKPPPPEPPPPPPPPPPPIQTPPPRPPPPPHKPEVEDVHVYGPSAPPIVGVCDVRFHGGELWAARAGAPNDNATKLLQTATPILTTNEGGEGHAEAIFMRGFDAREGQDIEFTANGVPINESGNLHGNGYVDTHFIIPELVQSIRVVEGPFDPRQGNYAVAGSADYELGLAQRGLIAKYTGGAWNTHRGLVMWGPEGASQRTFAAADVYSTDGWGQGRDAMHGSAMAQYEGKLGEKGIWHLGAQGYATTWHSPGFVREDDYLQGKMGFHDSYDWRYGLDAVKQGGDASRYSAWGDVESRVGETTLKQQVFLIKRDMRLLENFTGFVEDPRGDEIDVAVNSLTFGARGSARWRAKAFGQRQELELGYFARGDDTADTQQRLEAATGNPYRRETDLHSTLADVGFYADASLRFTKWLNVRGGLRTDVVTFDILDNVDNAKRTSASAIVPMPRGSIIFGPFEGFSLSGSVGTGVQTADPTYVTENPGQAPYSSVLAWEGGASFARVIKNETLVSARSVFFQTHLSNDLFFSEDVGRNVLGVGTTRTGWLGAARVTGRNFDVSTNATIVNSQYDDTHLPVEYVPPVVLRADAAVFGDLPLAIDGTKLHVSLASGLSWAARRPLPFGFESEEIFTLDASLLLRWRQFEIGVTGTNLTNNNYRVGEFAFASDFHTQSPPSAAPVRMFNAGPPLGVFASLSIRLGK